MGKLVEGVWDCNQCGNIGIKASNHMCPGCGNPQNKDTKFRLPGKISYVPESVEKTINRNPNWICNYCGGQNQDDLENCLGCGASRNGTHDYFKNKTKSQENEGSSYDTEDLDSRNYESTKSSTNNGDTPVRFNNFKSGSLAIFKNSYSSYKNIVKISAIVAIVLMMIVGTIYLLIPREKTVTIQQILWEREVTVERYQTVDESGWTVPYGGRLQYEKEEFSHNEQKFVGYETKVREVEEQYISGYEQGPSSYRDLGNGYFEEIPGASYPVYSTRYRTETYQEPIYVWEAVYRTKYYYEIEKWLFERNTKTNGSNTIEPYWGEEDSGMKSDEQISSRYEKYFILVVDSKEKEQSITIPYLQWSELHVGQVVKVKVNIFGTGEILNIEE